MELLILMIGMFAVMWLLLIRPQRRRQTQQAEMLAALEVGDEILTAGGVYGEVQAVEDDELRVEIAPGTTVRLDRRAVAAVFEAESEDENGEPGARAASAATDETTTADADSSAARS